MNITKKKLNEMIDRLGQDDRHAAYEFISFLIYKSKRRLTWEEIDQLEADDNNLTEEEKHQFNQAGDYITLEKAIDEYEL